MHACTPVSQSVSQLGNHQWRTRKKGLKKQFQRETLRKKLSYRLVPLRFDASFDSDPGELCSFLNVKRQVRVYMNKESPRREKWNGVSYDC